MKILTIIVSLILVGCGPTTKELQRSVEICKNSLVQGEDGEIRKRTQEEFQRDCQQQINDLAESDRRANPSSEYPKCPRDMVSVCRGPSCGRAPRHESDLKDYQCVNRAEIQSIFRAYP